MRFTLSTAVLALALTVPAAAAETVSVRVDLAGIDLSSSEGRQAAEARVDAQRRAACTIEADSRFTFGRTIIDEKCLADARTAALAQVESVAMNAARSGGAVTAN